MSGKHTRRRWSCWTSLALCELLLIAGPSRAGDKPVAKIEISSEATAIGPLVEAKMKFRGNDYVLTLRGLSERIRSEGTVDELRRAHDISGLFKPINSEGDLRNASGVIIHFSPPLPLESDHLEIELFSRTTPKISEGHREGGVE